MQLNLWDRFFHIMEGESTEFSDELHVAQIPGSRNHMYDEAFINTEKKAIKFIFLKIFFLKYS